MNYEDIFDVGTILIVEDDVLSAETLIDKLAVLAYENVLVATDLKEADRLRALHRIDLALLDVKLAKGARTIELGQSLAREGVRVVFMSGFNRIEMARATQGFEFIEKPISLPRLKATLQRAIIRGPVVDSFPNHI